MINKFLSIAFWMQIVMWNEAKKVVQAQTLLTRVFTSDLLSALAPTQNGTQLRSLINL
jgi:hypothetical protein